VYDLVKHQNGRPVYKSSTTHSVSDTGVLYIYFFQGSGRHQWLVSDNYTEPSGWMFCEDSAHTPDTLTEVWHRAGIAHWHTAPSVKLRCQEAAPTPAPTAEIGKWHFLAH
jgi:hypothetical protein